MTGDAGKLHDGVSAGLAIGGVLALSKVACRSAGLVGAEGRFLGKP